MVDRERDSKKTHRHDEIESIYPPSIQRSTYMIESILTYFRNVEYLDEEKGRWSKSAWGIQDWIDRWAWRISQKLLLIVLEGDFAGF